MKTIKIILIIIFCFAGLIFALPILRDNNSSIRNIKVAKNIVIPVKNEYSQRKYYGHPHGFGFGGGDYKSSIDFEYKDVSYFHKTVFIPVVIKFYKNSFYIVYFDRETNPRNSSYRFFKSNKDHKFEEILATDFPKHIAIQNWFWKSKNQSEKVFLEPEKIVATTTSHLWYLIEGKPKISNYEENIEFVTNYMNKYMNINYKK